jgi:hypothetical protein
METMDSFWLPESISDYIIILACDKLYVHEFTFFDFHIKIKLCVFDTMRQIRQKLLRQMID